VQAPPAQRSLGGLIVISAVLVVVKVAAGIFGNSWALIADGIESAVDILGGLIVWSGFRIAVQPADADHPFGHGRAETLASLGVALLILAAGVYIAVEAIYEIVTPHHLPAPWTLAVLAGVIVTKEGIYHWLRSLGRRLNSNALLAEAWHHRGDALTSAAAFIGIVIALWAGPGYESADDWAALVACAIIVANGGRLLKRSLDDLMDRSVDESVIAEVRAIAACEPGVSAIEKCRIRRSGLGLRLDIHVQVSGVMSVRDGHALGHLVQDRLFDSHLPIEDVLVHLEPFEEDHDEMRAHLHDQQTNDQPKPQSKAESDRSRDINAD
jgi:cation diffusion facilitator family transporter